MSISRHTVFLLDHKMCAALCIVPQHVGESIGAIWEDETGETAYPQIRVVIDEEEENGERYDIIVDGMVICSNGNFVRALGILLATYYVFNLEYPKGLMNTLTFYQVMFLQLPDIARLPRVVKLMCTLENIE